LDDSEDEKTVDTNLGLEKKSEESPNSSLDGALKQSNQADSSQPRNTNPERTNNQGNQHKRAIQPRSTNSAEALRPKRNTTNEGDYDQVVHQGSFKGTHHFKTILGFTIALFWPFILESSHYLWP